MTAKESQAHRQLGLAALAVTAASDALHKGDLGSARMHTTAAAEWCATTGRTLAEVIKEKGEAWAAARKVAVPTEKEAK